jgi:hypothetical protein
VTALKGLFGKATKMVSIEEINAAIARRARLRVIGFDIGVLTRYLMRD